MSRRSRVRTGRASSCHASTPPTTLVPPPKGTTARSCWSAYSTTATTASSASGYTTASGARVIRPQRRFMRSRYDRPAAWDRRDVGSTATAPSPAIRRRSSRAGPDRRLAGIETRSSGTTPRRTPSVRPSFSWRNRHRPGRDSAGGRWSSNPQPHHFSGRPSMRSGESRRAT